MISPMQGGKFHFTEEELQRLKALSRIDCSAEEALDLVKKIGGTLEQIQLLNEVNTDGVEECSSPISELANVWRDDLVSDVLPREQLLSNAPDHVGGMVRTPPVIKF